MTPLLGGLPNGRLGRTRPREVPRPSGMGPTTAIEWTMTDQRPVFFGASVQYAELADGDEVLSTAGGAWRRPRSQSRVITPSYVGSDASAASVGIRRLRKRTHFPISWLVRRSSSFPLRHSAKSAVGRATSMRCATIHSWIKRSFGSRSTKAWAMPAHPRHRSVGHICGDDHLAV